MARAFLWMSEYTKVYVNHSSMVELLKSDANRAAEALESGARHPFGKYVGPQMMTTVRCARGRGQVMDGLWTEARGQRTQSNDPRQQPAQPPIRQLLGAADAQTAHPATSGTAPAHQLLGSANAETTPAGAPAAAADRTQRPDATCEGKNG